MTWMLRKGFKDWEIWENQEKYDERALPFLKQCPNQFATLEELEEWLLGEEKKKAKSATIRLLARQNYPSQILKRKLLMKGFRHQVADEMVAWAIREGYVQDVEFIRSFIRNEMIRGVGPKAIFWKLRSKEFSEKFINQELQIMLPMDRQVESACKFLRQKKYGSNPQKAIQLLLRRGFSMDVIRVALKFSTSGKSGKWDDVSDVFHSSDE